MIIGSIYFLFVRFFVVLAMNMKGESDRLLMKYLLQTEVLLTEPVKHFATK